MERPPKPLEALPTNVRAQWNDHQVMQVVNTGWGYLADLALTAHERPGPHSPVIIQDHDYFASQLLVDNSSELDIAPLISTYQRLVIAAKGREATASASILPRDPLRLSLKGEIQRFETFTDVLNRFSQSNSRLFLPNTALTQDPELKKRLAEARWLKLPSEFTREISEKGSHKWRNITLAAGVVLISSAAVAFDIPPGIQQNAAAVWQEINQAARSNLP